MFQHSVMVVRPHNCGCWEVVGEEGPAGVLLSLNDAMDAALDWVRQSGGRVELSLSQGLPQPVQALRAA